MAPALPVYTRDEIEKMYPKLFRNKEAGIESGKVPENCKLNELVQYQCTYDGNKVYCLPFKRVFLRCKERRSKEVIGYKLTPSHGTVGDIKNRLNVGKNDFFYRDIEITDKHHNSYLYPELKSIDTKESDAADLNDKDLQEFLKANKVLKDKMRQYYDKFSQEK